jgi:hypothetical protein
MRGFDRCRPREVVQRGLLDCSLYTSFTPLPRQYPHLLLTPTWPQPLRVCSSASANIMPSEHDESTAGLWVSGECVDLTYADCQTPRSRRTRTLSLVIYRRTRNPAKTRPSWTLSAALGDTGIYPWCACVADADYQTSPTRKGLVALGQHGLCRSLYRIRTRQYRYTPVLCMRGRC